MLLVSQSETSAHRRIMSYSKSIETESKYGMQRMMLSFHFLLGKSSLGIFQKQRHTFLFLKNDTDTSMALREFQNSKKWYLESNIDYNIYLIIYNFMNIWNTVKLNSIQEAREMLLTLKKRPSYKSLSRFKSRVLSQIRLLEHWTDYESWSDKTIVIQWISELRDIIARVDSLLALPQDNVRSFAFSYNSR